MLKPQDVVVAIRLAIPTEGTLTYPDLAAALRLSSSEAHSAVKRATHAGAR